MYLKNILRFLNKSILNKKKTKALQGDTENFSGYIEQKLP